MAKLFGAEDDTKKLRACSHCGEAMVKLKDPQTAASHWECRNSSCSAPSRPHKEFESA